LLDLRTAGTEQKPGSPYLLALVDPSLFGIFIRRMIVAMMDANHISERLSSLKNEMSELRVTNALYWNRKGYTALEKSASGLRHRRLAEIKLELADLMKCCA
jgi:hypothetical protein